MAAKKKKLGRQEALTLIGKHVEKAKKVFLADPAFSRKLSRKALRVSTKNKVKMPSFLKRQICKNCRSILMPGTNARIRIKKGKAVYFCRSCKRFMKVG